MEMPCGEGVPRIPPPPCPHHYWRSPESGNFPQCRLAKCPGSPHLQLESHLQPLGSQKTSCSPWPSPSACRVTVPGIDLRMRGEPDENVRPRRAHPLLRTFSRPPPIPEAEPTGSAASPPTRVLAVHAPGPLHVLFPLPGTPSTLTATSFPQITPSQITLLLTALCQHSPSPFPLYFSPQQ